MRNSVDRLQAAGYGLFFIGHSKLKKKNTGTVIGDNQDFMQYSCNLLEDFSTVFEEMADMITYLIIDRTINGNSEDAKTRTAKNTVNMHFRSEDGSIDCGGRFKDLPYELPYSAENYMVAFTHGVKASKLKPMSNDEMAVIAIEQEKEADVKAEEATKPITIKKMIDKIKKEFNNLGEDVKASMFKIIEDAEIEGFDNLTEKDRLVVEKMYELVL